MQRILSKVVVLTLIVMVLAGCSHVRQYLSFWESERELKAAFVKEPTADLLRSLQPGDSFLLAGPVQLEKKGYKGPMLVVAVTDMFKSREIVAARILQTPVLYYQIYLPEGNYDLFFFADLDGNGYFDADEMVGQTSGSPIHIRKEEVKDGLTFIGPAFALDTNKSRTTDLSIKVQVRSQDFIVNSLDDEFFDPQYGEMGLYNPKKFFAHTQRFIFSLENIDPNKTMIIFVHGVAGTPRDFKYLVDGLDRNRYQPWFFYYPSGMPLQKLGSLLADILEVLGRDKHFQLNRVIVVAHSMGGLVSLAALNELCRNNAPNYLKGYISFNSPYGGVETAKKAVEQAPAVVAAWRDVAPGSSFLERLYQGSATQNIPFHLFFGYTTGDSSDGTITLQSQLEQKIQFAAHKSYGFNASHVGILNDNQARQTFYRVLESLERKKSIAQYRNK